MRVQTNNPLVRCVATACLCLTLPLAALAAGTKDIVLDRINPVTTTTAVQATSDAMAVSILVESPDGSLAPRSTEVLFRTGEHHAGREGLLPHLHVAAPYQAGRTRRVGVVDGHLAAA